VAWESGKSPYGEAAGSVRLSWEAWTGRWRAAHPLLPGKYEVSIRPVVVRGRPNVEEARAIRFEIRAGETTVIDLE